MTIPKAIRKVSNIDEGQIVSMLPIGESILITPKPLQLDEARRQMKKILLSSGMSVEELVEGLKEERAKLFGELYGDKQL
ncbi:MAG TPA: AbrB/MazE/SpoVT family DNA-binding domain-containing protein [Desulfuromonadales bacterium]|nr:AbrB/MazE/SpoVT family DNA-binding domain-containing protein [Desulfuromonadales bacterium]